MVVVVEFAKVYLFSAFVARQKSIMFVSSGSAVWLNCCVVNLVVVVSSMDPSRTVGNVVVVGTLNSVEPISGDSMVASRFMC